MTQFTKQKIQEVETKEDYDDLMERFKSSSATLEQKEEAMTELKRAHPTYDTTNRLPTKELRKQMEDCSADLDGLEGF